jgi:hypothetical protein
MDRVNPFVAIAGSVWTAGLYMTHTAVVELAVFGSFGAVVFSLWLQSMLTVTQIPLTSGRAEGAMWYIGVMSTVLDAMLNFGGAYHVTAHIHRIGSFRAFGDVVGQPGLFSQAIVVLVIALGFAVFIAWAPEKLWAYSKVAARR